ncbi:protein PTHB1 [Schistocerca cancellata]|uniref:protein PTHB1 n=1 Tax=Schistocerca cancellata TaxID=274614 RepID=UPI002118EA9D|nr:protein PTHB1 [Schistocerca cancellata]XP_049780720.1 protein PTHB1 [Schistocerca cancellata]
MSLFKARELWSTQCGADETFDQTSITIASIEGASENIIVGSHNGFLYIFQPSTAKSEDGKFIGYKPCDLLIETHLAHPILQVCVGKLVSGSQNLQIGILHPQSVAVYSLITRHGAAEHGDQRSLALAYEHQLRRSAFNMVIGPFGGARNRDFICVQSLDGALCFFEQETLSFIQFLPNFLLPGPVVYLVQLDAFVTVSSHLHIECYSYQQLAERSRIKDQDVQEGRKLVAEWSYNLGEAVIDIEIVSWTSHDDIVVLGERNFFCVQQNGVLKFMKRLEYRPSCFYPYIAESSGKLMVLIGTEMNTLLIYEQTTLRWSCQLVVCPLAVKKINLQDLKGVLAVLSEDGLIHCCYLGTEPSLFIPPPLEVTEINYQEAGKELAELQKIINSYSKDSTITLASGAAEREVCVEVNMNSRLETTSHEHMLGAGIDPPACQISVHLRPHVPLNKVQVAVIVQPPLEASQVSHTVNSLCAEFHWTTYIYLSQPGDVPSLEMRVVTSYVTNSRSIPRILQHFAQLPLKLVAKPCAPEKNAEFKIAINSNLPIVEPLVLFPEFSFEDSGPETVSSVGFAPCFLEKNIVTISTVKSLQQYHLQCNTFSSLCLFVYQLVHRLNKHFAKNKQFSCGYTSSLPLQELFEAIEARFRCRKESFKLEANLARKAAQFRIVQRRLLTKFKDKILTPMNNLENLLKDTYTKILISTDLLEENQKKLKYLSIQVSCCVRLLLFLLKLQNPSSQNNVDDLESALSCSVNDSDDQGWDEITDAAVSYLLRTSLAKSVKDQQRSAPISLDALQDIARVKKHISMAFERTCRGSQLPGKKEHNVESSTLHVGISPIPEATEINEDDEGTIPRGSQLAEKKQSNLVPGTPAGLLTTRRAKLQLPAIPDGSQYKTDFKKPATLQVSSLEKDKPPEFPPEPLENIKVTHTAESPEEDDDIW